MSIDSGKRTFWTDWWRKLFALIFALISFFIINGKIAQYRTIENVKVEFNIPDSNMVTVLDDNITAKIVVETTLPLGSLKADSYRVVVNISPRKEDHKYRIKVNVGPQNVRKGLFMPSARSVTLSKDSVELDPIVSKSVPIVVQVTGVTRPGFTATTTLNPDTVTIAGPSEKLKSVRFISGGDLPMTPDTTDFTCRLPLLNGNADIRLIGTESVEVVTRIVSINEMLTKKFPDVPIRIINEYPQVYAVERMSSKSGVVEMRGLKSILDSYENTGAFLFVDLNEAKAAGTFHARVYAGNLPPKDKAEVKYSPDFVDVILYEVSKEKPAEKEKAKEPEAEEKETNDEKAEDLK